MIKNFLFTVALLSLTLAVGCAKGGNGIIIPPPTLTVDDGSVSAIYPNQSLTFTASVGQPAEPVTATWTLSGSACTGSPNPCGTIDATTGIYQAPATPPSPPQITVTATAVSNTAETGSLQLDLVLVSVVVTPTPVSVGDSLVQQFTAVAIPDDAPQTFTWSAPTCTNGTNCGTLVQDSKTSGLAVYTAPASNPGSVIVAATSTVQQTSPPVGQAKVSVVTSRLLSGTYAFQFSGFDTGGNHVAAAGAFILASDGSINDGVEDVLSASGPHHYSISSVSFNPISNNNNLGTLTLALTGGPTNRYTAVITSSGIIRMIESDNAGTGAGVMQVAAKNTVFNSGGQTFAFGFTGVDKQTGGNRVGYVGLLPLNGSGVITAGLLDSNDNGSDSTVCSSPPCAITTGVYSQQDAVNLPTWWRMTLTTAAATQNFDFFVSAGTAETKTAPGSLTLYAISTDPVDATHPALSGSMVYQVPGVTYNNAAFSGTSVSNLTGVTPAVANSSNVALIVGNTDGTSGGTNGAGGFVGTFDQNNNGAILSVLPTAAFSYTYVASGSATGRYTFQMLGNPIATPVVPSIPFVLYASGVNRGFLLDQSSAAVMTGTMDPQPTTIKNFNYVATALPGTFAAATISSSDPSVAPVVQNLLLTSTGNATYNVAGTQNPSNEALTGTYTLNDNSIPAAPLGGTGAIALTTPSVNYVIYAIDGNANDAITDFMMMGTCVPQAPATTCASGPASSIMFAQE